MQNESDDREMQYVLDIWTEKINAGQISQCLFALGFSQNNTSFFHFLKMIYAFSFWMLLRQQLIEKQEKQKLKEENLHEVKSTSMKSFFPFIRIIRNYKCNTSIDKCMSYECYNSAQTLCFRCYISELEVCLCLCPGIADKTESSRMVNRIGAFLKGILVKYWIVCCCSMFFVISFSGKVVVYKILYICLFLICVVLYQVRFPLHLAANILTLGSFQLDTPL